jgi:hypothetical protein
VSEPDGPAECLPDTTRRRFQVTRMILPIVGLGAAVALRRHILRNPVFPEGCVDYRVHRRLLIATIVAGVMWVAATWLLGAEPLPSPPDPPPRPSVAQPVRGGAPVGGWRSACARCRLRVRPAPVDTDPAGRIGPVQRHLGDT